MYQISIIRPSGEIIRSEHDKDPDLLLLQASVGGQVQEVPHFQRFEGQVGVAYADEEGIQKELPLNVAATRAWLTNLGKGPFSYPPRLFGDVVFVSRHRRGG